MFVIRISRACDQHLKEMPNRKVRHADKDGVGLEGTGLTGPW